MGTLVDTRLCSSTHGRSRISTSDKLGLPGVQTRFAAEASDGLKRREIEKCRCIDLYEGTMQRTAFDTLQLAIGIAVCCAVGSLLLGSSFCRPAHGQQSNKFVPLPDGEARSVAVGIMAQLNGLSCISGPEIIPNPVALFPPLDFCRMAERASQGGRHAVGSSAFAPSAFVSPPFITQSAAVGRRHAGGARRRGRGHAAAARQSGAAELADEPPLPMTASRFRRSGGSTATTSRPSGSPLRVRSA